ALLEHLVHQGGLPMVYVGNNGNISQLLVPQRKNLFLFQLKGILFTTLVLYYKIFDFAIYNVDNFSFFEYNISVVSASVQIPAGRAPPSRLLSRRTAIVKYAPVAQLYRATAS